MFNLISKDKNEALSWFKKTLSALDFKYKYEFTTKRYRHKRSHSQNSTYFAWITALANYLGYDKYDLHEAYARRYLGWEEKDLPGDLGYWDRKHTPDENTIEFNDYMNNIHNHAYDKFGFWLPYPDEPAFKVFMEKYKYICKGELIEYE